MTVPSPRTFNRVLDDGSVVAYTLRSLREESEIVAWSVFCAAAFSYKPQPPPPEYFANHYWNDPDREISWIRVAESEDEGIVASVRVFRRWVSNGSGGYWTAGGIGEVCTSPDHRRRGLSKALLEDALEIMAGLQVSLLHAAPAFRPFYASMGYAPLTSEWTVARISDWKSWTTERCDKIDWDCSLYEEEQRHVCGSIRRSVDYWESWIGPKALPSCYALKEGARGMLHVAPDKKKDGQFVLSEYAGLGEDSSRLFRAMVTAFFEEHSLPSSFDLKLPTVVFQSIQDSFEDPRPDNDDGWMYRSMNGGTSMLEVEKPHLIWPGDSF